MGCRIAGEQMKAVRERVVREDEYGRIELMKAYEHHTQWGPKQGYSLYVSDRCTQQSYQFQATLETLVQLRIAIGDLIGAGIGGPSVATGEVRIVIVHEGPPAAAVGGFTVNSIDESPERREIEDIKKGMRKP